jgi:hypothetical protein
MYCMSGCSSLMFYVYFVDGILATCALVVSLCVKSRPSRIGDIAVSTTLNEIARHYDGQK